MYGLGTIKRMNQERIREDTEALKIKKIRLILYELENDLGMTSNDAISEIKEVVLYE